MRLLYRGTHRVVFRIGPPPEMVASRVLCEAGEDAACHYRCDAEECHDQYTCHHPKLNMGGCTLETLEDPLWQHYAGPVQLAKQESISVLWDDYGQYFAWAYTSDIDTGAVNLS